MAEQDNFIEDSDFSSLLIELIQNHEYLYNLGHKDYKNAKKKRDAWAKIAAALNASVDDCMKQWKGIRDKYTRQRRDGFRSGSSVGTRWPLHSKMSFFKRFSRPRKFRASKIMPSEPQASALDATACVETPRKAKKRKVGTEGTERVVIAKSIADGLKAPSSINLSFTEHLCHLLDAMTEEEAAAKRRQLITCFFPE
uniref:MADF domain-containing protein n=1 Tax=Dendroctonus ponderosae TaxID=77166 RepID=A0AAR5PXL9_DENPD